MTLIPFFPNRSFKRAVGKMIHQFYNTVFAIGSVFGGDGGVHYWGNTSWVVECVKDGQQFHVKFFLEDVIKNNSPMNISFPWEIIRH